MSKIRLNKLSWKKEPVGYGSIIALVYDLLVWTNFLQANFAQGLSFGLNVFISW